MSIIQFTFGLEENRPKLSKTTVFKKSMNMLKIKQMEEMSMRCKLLNLNHFQSQLILELISQSGKMKSVKHGWSLTHTRPKCKLLLTQRKLLQRRNGAKRKKLNMQEMEPFSMLTFLDKAFQKELTQQRKSSIYLTSNSRQLSAWIKLHSVNLKLGDRRN